MKKKFSVVLALAMVFVMMMGSGVMAAPAVREQISNILEAEITVEEVEEPIDPQDWIKLSWGEGTDGDIKDDKLTVTVNENEAKTAVVKAEKHEDIETIERVLYIMEVKDKDDQAIGKDVLEAVASDGQKIGYDDEGDFWYWGSRSGFTFSPKEYSTEFTYTFSEAGTYDIEIYAVQLYEEVDEEEVAKEAFLAAATSYNPGSEVYEYSFDGTNLTIDFDFANLNEGEIAQIVMDAAGDFLDAVFDEDNGNAREVVINMNGQEITLTSENETENIVALAAAVFDIAPDKDGNIDGGKLIAAVTKFVEVEEGDGTVTADFTMTVTNQEGVTFTLDNLKATFNNVTQ